MSDQNPYAAPQAILSNSDGLGPESDLQLSPEFFPAAAGGKYCTIAIIVLFVSFICTFVLMFLIGILAVFLFMIAAIVSLMAYLVGLSKLCELPRETGARTPFTIAFVFALIYAVMIFLRFILDMNGRRDESSIMQMAIEFVQMIITIATLFGQRAVGKYTADSKLLLYNLCAAIGYGILLITGLILLFLAFTRSIDIESWRNLNDNKMTVLACVMILSLLTVMTLFAFGYASAFKRISDIAKEYFMQRKTTSTNGLPGQNPDQNQFDFFK